MNVNFWKDKRVLVTGHNGFKGTWLTKWLDMLGAEVLGVSLKPSENNEFSKLSFSSRYNSLEIDIRNKELLNIVYEFSPEIVFHLAAQSIVSIAKTNPVETFSTNVMGTVNLLESLCKLKTVKSIIVVTSDKVYENNESLHAYEETDALMGNEPYSCSKVAEEQVAKAYYESYFKYLGVGLVTVRASNVFGGGDYHFDRLIPYLEKCDYEGKIPEIRNRDAIRPWQYVLDTLNGYLTLMEYLFLNPNDTWDSYNFGPKSSELYTVGQIADIICGQLEVAMKKQEFQEAGLLLINSDKSMKRLGWNPRYTLREALMETKSSYLQYFKNGNSDKIYENAIDNFMKK